MNKEFYTPEIDVIIGRYSDFGAHNRLDRYFESSEISTILEKFIESLQAIKPQMDGQDKGLLSMNS